MKIATFRWAILYAVIFSFGILRDSARADSIVRFTYGGKVPGIYDVQVYCDTTPITSKNFLRYVNNGVYNYSILHRYTTIGVNTVVAMEGGGFKLRDPSDYVAYPDSDPEKLLEIEPYTTSDGETGASNVQGTLAMMKVKLEDGSYNATSRWDVNITDNSSTRDGSDSNYVVFGKVLDPSMTYLRSIDLNNPKISIYDLRSDYNQPDLDAVPLFLTYSETDYSLSFLVVSSATVVPAAWKGGSPTGNNWDTPANWSSDYADNSCVPDGAGSLIDLANTTNDLKTVEMGTIGRTVGSITFSGSGSGGMEIAGSASLTLDNIDKAAEIKIVSGNHTIKVPVILGSDANINNSGTLTLTSGINSASDHDFALKIVGGILNITGGISNITSIRADTLTIGTPSVIVVTPSWKGGDSADSKDWGMVGNWDGTNSVPGGAGSEVVFGNQSQNYSEVDLKTADRTVGVLHFASQTGTTITSSDSHSLTLNNLANAAVIDFAGSHAIIVPVILAGDANISGTGTLDLTGISGNTHALTIAGGTLKAASIQVNTLTIGSPGAAAAVPEPSTAALLCMGIAGLFACGWRRKK
jgi:cyclophilin family peptidyl-prolyl cis-trans isomerase